MTHTPAEPTPAYDLPPPPGQPPAAPKRAWYRRGWVLFVAGLVVGVALAAAGNNNKTATTAAAPAVAQTATVTAKATAAAAAPALTKTTTVEATVTVTATPKVIATRTQQVRVTFTPAPQNQFSDGTYLVPKEVPYGQYKTDGKGDGAGCYWARMKDLSGAITSINANDNISGPTTIEISPGDAAIKVNGGCQWAKVG
jgi:hypothetical protein